MVVNYRLARQLDEGALATDLGSNLIVWETIGREDGDLLATGNGVHDVNSRNASLDHLLRVDPGVGIDGLALDVQEVLCHDSGSLVNWFPRSIENSSQHVLRNWCSQDVTSEFACGLLCINARSAFKDL